jgi:hypothetical protein
VEEDVSEAESRRAARRAEHERARDEQAEVDLVAIDALEAERGEPLHTMTANRFVAGVAYKVAFRAPTALEYKRYADMVGRAQAKGDVAERKKGQEMLASAVIVYPAGEALKTFTEAFPGVLLSVTIEAAKVAELRSEEEGKG